MATMRNSQETRGSWRRGVFALEYAALIVVVAAALLGMAVYLKRALSDRWRNVGDSFGYGRQYEPRVTDVQ